ncbi:MAG: glucoamylase family protein [Chitinophagaceae bacterium]
MKKIYYIIFLFTVLVACKKEQNTQQPPAPPPTALQVAKAEVDGMLYVANMSRVQLNPVIRLQFSAKLAAATVQQAIQFTNAQNVAVPFNFSLLNGDSVLQITPSSALAELIQFTIQIKNTLKSTQDASLASPYTVTFSTGYDMSEKFPRIADTALLTLVQKQTFGYFWDFAHPVSGMARERNSSGDVVTTGGTGFGLMTLPVAVERKFITRTMALESATTIVNFLSQKAIRYHGAFAHWLHGTTGATVPFSANDNGADLVETSLLMQGLLTIRQYFNQPQPAEQALVNQINQLWQGVEWNWFTQNNQSVLYWHWSPDKNWAMNLPIRGWNESLITYVLATSSTTNNIATNVYKQGWAQNGLMKNGNNFFGYTLPLGPSGGGPLFFAHYSFLGIHPKDLVDEFANYEQQNIRHTQINWAYCKANPKGFPYYSDSCWGLTASDIPGGYTASSPTNDVGVIAPTAALASMPYTPEQSMQALRFFYYRLGNKLWGNYGFYDAFSLKDNWFSNSYLAIDQGPIVIMIENYRSGLLWQLFISCPEVKNGLKKLGFSSPYI